MTFRFDNIVENWASIYSPIGHDKQRNSANKRFFRIKTISTDNEFARKANVLKSPCVLFSVLVDAEIGENRSAVKYRYEIYFASKAEQRSLAQTSRQDEALTADQHLLMDEMVQDLIAYLSELRQTSVCPVTGRPLDPITIQGLRGLQLDKAEWMSMPVKFSDWHIMGLSIDGYSPRRLCVMPERYNNSNC